MELGYLRCLYVQCGRSPPDTLTLVTGYVVYLAQTAAGLGNVAVRDGLVLEALHM